MPRLFQPEFGWSGLNTRAKSTGLPLLECTVLQDMRVKGMDLEQRLGMVRVAQLGGNQSAASFTAASSMYLSNTIDARVWALGLYWTVEFAFQATSAAGTQGLVTAGHTTPAMVFDITGGNIRARVWDSAAVLTTITVGAASTNVATVQLTRSGSTLSAKLDNGTAVTGSISSTLSVRTPVGDLRVARDDGANYFGGTFDKLDVLTIVKSDHKDRLVRLPAPRARYVMASYDFDIKSGPLCYDRSRYENNLITQATPVEIASLSVNPAPIRALAQSVDAATNRKQLVAVAGGSYFVADLD